jgi:accessory gene regulator protein AgrB
MQTHEGIKERKKKMMIMLVVVVVVMMIMMTTTCTYLAVLWNPTVYHYDHKRTFRIYSEPVQSSLCFQTLFL